MLINISSNKTISIKSMQSVILLFHYYPFHSIPFFHTTLHIQCQVLMHYTHVLHILESKPFMTSFNPPFHCRLNFPIHSTKSNELQFSFLHIHTSFFGLISV